MGQTVRYYGKLFVGVAAGFLVLDHWAGTNAIVGTGFKGASGLLKTAQGRA
jgi:hypothetical protein